MLGTDDPHHPWHPPLKTHYNQGLDSGLCLELSDREKFSGIKVFSYPQMV